MVVVAIGAMSLLVAAVTFGVLESTGSSGQPGVSLGGAIVGFLATFALLQSFYKWNKQADASTELERNRREVEQLRASNDALRLQVMRGLHLPDDFQAEVLDHHKIVMARPKRYRTRGGVILDVATHEEAVDIEADLDSIDAVPARLSVTYEPMFLDGDDDFYELYRDRARNDPWIELLSVERTLVGVDEHSRPAIQMLYRRVADVAIQRDPITNRLKIVSTDLLRSEWPDIEQLDGSEFTVTKDEVEDVMFTRSVQVAIMTKTVACFHRGLKQVFHFTLEDDETDFEREVEVLHRCLRSVRFLA